MSLERDLIHGIIWDLDNTLYKFTDAFYKSCTEAAAHAAQELGIDLSYEETLKLAERSEQEHGYSMHGYVTDHGLSYASLHFPFHSRIDETVIEPFEDLAEKLENLDLPQVILTNASRCWAERALKFCKIDHLFNYQKIIAMEDVNFEPKARSQKGFIKAADLLGSDPKNILMVDDLDRNLMIANDLNMHTVYVHYNDQIKDLPDYIDAQYYNILDVIKQIN